MRPTKAFDRIDVSAGFDRLDGSRSVLDLADAARIAGFAFVSSAKCGWSKRETAAWLANDYSGATLMPALAPSSVVQPSAKPIAPTMATEDEVTRLVASTRRHVVEMLTTLAGSYAPPGFVRDLVESGLVVGVSDATSFGYAAVNRPRMRLVDRVRSLFVADFLSRPRDYESFLVCPSCDEISFKWDEVHEEDCTMRGPRSGIIVKRFHATFVGIGNDAPG